MSLITDPLANSLVQCFAEKWKGKDPVALGPWLGFAEDHHLLETLSSSPLGCLCTSFYAPILLQGNILGELNKNKAKLSTAWLQTTSKDHPKQKVTLQAVVSHQPGWES